MMKLYDVTNPEFNENAVCETCDKWLQNIQIAFENCSRFREKVWLLNSN